MNYITKYQDSGGNVNKFLDRLDKVKPVGDGRFMACCPVQQEKNPSLAVTQKPDGLVLIHCFSCGASGIDVCNALGVDPSSLFPPSANPKYEKQPRLGFSAWQLLNALEKDALMVLIAARMLLSGETLPESDVVYLGEVVVRISEALQYLERAL